jgi:uncharacterized membrane protein (DUF441 family)
VAFNNIALLVVLVMAVMAENQPVSVAAAFLLILKQLGCDAWFPILEDQGVNIGLTVLTIAILVPVASGRITIRDMYTSIFSPVGFLAVLTGILAAWLGGQGLLFFKTSPDTITALILGTIVGISFFQGIAVGPLIAAGMLSMFIRLYR